MGLDVLLYIPNIIGYMRILLAALALAAFQHPDLFVTLYTTSISLDGLDGFLARRLNQCTKFGAWFDVVIDLFTRGFLWCALFRCGYLVVFLEWMTFMATHSRGENWKIPDEQFPALVKMVMANGFKTPLGFYAVGSLHILPLWLYGYESHFLTQTLGVSVWCQLTCVAVLAVGRTICAAVELFYIKEYILHLLNSNDGK